MQFELWQALGVSPRVGIAIAVGGLVVAALLAVGMAMRRARSSPVVRIGIHEDR